MRDIIKMNILTKFHENIPFGTKVIIRKPKVDAARATERETEPVVPRVVVRTEIRQHVARQRAHRMKIGPARFVRRRIGRKTIPPELRARVGDEGELAFGDSELQGIAGHAAPE